MGWPEALVLIALIALIGFIMWAFAKYGMLN
jgi:hypothetical protein